MRRFNWLIPVLVTTCLVGYFLVLPWYRDKGNAKVVETLTADLDTATKAINDTIAAIPEQWGVADLERMTQLSKTGRDLIERTREIAPTLKGETGKLFLEAQERYRKAMDRRGEKINAMESKLKKKGD